MENEIIDLYKAELQVQEETVRKHSKEFELIEKTKNTFIDGLNLLGFYKINNEVDEAWLLIITRSFHSFRCSIDLMKKAYYSQAVAILRMMTEDYFICGNCEKDPNIVRAVLYGESIKPDGKKMKLNYSTLATNMGAPKVYSTYELQCDYVHCSNRSLGALSELIDEKTVKVKIVPAYDKSLFMMCCEMLIRNSLRILCYLDIVLERLPAERVNIWNQEFGLVVNDVKDWVARLKPNYS